MAKTLDASALSVTEVNRALRAASAAGEESVVRNPDSKHQICVGVLGPAKVKVEGSAGYFCGGLCDGPSIEVSGNVGWGVGDNMLSGEVVVSQNASAIAGVGLRGGTVVVKGNLGSRAGQVMKDGWLLCGGRASFMAGYMMMGGRIAICGDSGEAVGQNMINGSIFVGGKIDSLGDDARIVEPEPKELEELKAMLAKYGIAAPEKFSKVVSAQSQLHYKLYERGEGEGGAPMPPRKSFSFPKGSRWTSKAVEEITAKAEIGRYRIRGYGASRELPTFDDIAFKFDPARLSGVSDVRGKCSLKTTLGGKFGGKPLSLDIPVLIAPMSFGALSKNVKVALAMGSRLAGTATNTGEGGMSPEEREAAKTLIYQCLSGRFGFNPHDMKRADAIELYISQGAKPGLGGQLMGKKITEEIARIRGIPKGIDLRSPSRHPDVMGADDLVIKIEEFREATDWQVPISLKLGAGRLKDDIKIALKDMVDFVQIDGMQGGTGASSEVVTENVGIPTLAAIVQAVNGLKQIDADGQLPIVLMGGMHDGLDAAKALALGATAVATGTGALIAAGCIACMRCHVGNCVRGIATQKPELTARLNVEEASQRVASFLNGMADEMAAITLACGKTDVHQLSREDLVALTPQAAAITGLPLAENP